MRTLLRPGWGLFFLALLLPWMSGCDQGSLSPPEVSNDLFRSYVSIGNSITAGFQSGGINQNTQEESYAVLLAEQAGTPFNIPALEPPGCPPPLAQAFPPQTIAPDVDCALRGASVSSPLNNVAVPNAALIDVLSNQRPSSNPNELTSFILGGQTQINAAKKANPTFASAWIGNNDVLGAAIVGDTTLATPVDSFRARYDRMVSELASIESLQGGVFLKVADVTLIPHFSSGAAYGQAIPQARSAGVVPSNFQLNACGTATSTLVPFRYGAALLQVAQAASSETITLDCSQDRTVEEAVRQSISSPSVEAAALQQISAEIKQISLLLPAETAFLQNRVSAFNQVIEDEVADNENFVTINPNTLFANNSDQLPAFPNLSGDAPFGPLFSLDGIHPSGAAHRLVANAMIDRITSTFEVSEQELPTVSSE